MREVRGFELRADSGQTSIFKAGGGYWTLARQVGNRKYVLLVLACSHLQGATSADTNTCQGTGGRGWCELGLG